MISSSTNPIRVAQIGVSGYGQIYLELALAAQNRGELELIAAVIINPTEEPATEARLRASGCQIYRDFEEMLRTEAGRLELCLIPTGIPWHARMTIAALQAGVNVLVEKPLAGSTREVALLRAAEHASGKFVAVGFQDLYSPVNHWLKAQLDAGVIGTLRSIRFLGLWPRPVSYFTRNSWAGRLQTDGTPVLDSPLNNAFAHFVNLCLFFGGGEMANPLRIEVEEAELFRAHAIESFDTSVVRARSQTGVSFWFGATHSCREIREPEIIIEGTLGRVQWNHETRCVLSGPEGRNEEQRLPDITTNRQSMFAAVLKKVRSPETGICDTAVAERHTAFVESVHAAAIVQSVPNALIEWNPSASNPQRVPVIGGLDASLLRAFEQGILLSQVGFALRTPASR